ncbi:hypothetical protein HHK36_018180 [Tetracentron sinense]|uniref:Ethylene-insensitive protein 2 n=1 Tax=Tetracentron sinense TaxID=13715 RepID=A0A835DB12_TETSI|nr:hypothetical protein HHK36_018180 [Tetracentron sinense]
MDAEISSVNQMPGVFSRLFPAVGPVLMISMGYVDPGKWAAAVEGGARFGSDLVLLILLFNFAAVLCQYLAARIGVVTGRNLAQENCKTKFMCISLAGFILLLYVLGVLISQSEIPLVMNGMLTRKRIAGQDDTIHKGQGHCHVRLGMHHWLLALAASLIDPLVLRASAHTEYCEQNGSLVQWHLSVGFSMLSLQIMLKMEKPHLGPPNVSKASVFHSTGLVVLTFQDALSLMDQVFRSSVTPFAFFLVLFFSSQITALTWNVGGQVVLHNFFRMDPPGWLHRATIRALAIVPALYCAWNSGAEGMYQLLIFTQVILAMLLPSSVIPLFRVSSSRSIMGAYKISQLVEFLALIAFIGMLGLNIIFVVEMLFGDSDWVVNLSSNMGSSMSLLYVVILITACTSLGLMLWLAATPLKSASVGLDAQMRNWDLQKVLPESSVEREENDLCKTTYHGEDLSAEEPASVKSLGSRSDNSVVDFDPDLPEIITDSDQEPHLASIEENCAITSVLSSPTCHPEESASMDESVPVSIVVNEVSDGGLLDASTLQKIESMDPVGMTSGVGDSRTDKDDDEGDTWEAEESSRGIAESGPSTTSEGPGSFRSLSGKSDEGSGNGGGSLSRLSGLGRAARRQLAAILDEFWGQLYDFHGQATREAKAKKLDVLLGVDPKPAAAPLDPAGTEFSGYYPSVGGRGSDLLNNSSIYNSPKQQRVPNSIESYYGVQTGPSSSWSTHMQLLDSYGQNSSRNILDPGEKRYSSLRLPLSSDCWDSGPATVHGYQIAPYLNQIATDSSDSLSVALESPTPKSPTYVPTNYRDSLTYALGQKQQKQISSVHASSLRNQMVSRNSQLQAERTYYDLCSSGPGENVGTPAYTKKYHSLPDISGLAVPHRDSYLSDRSAQWGAPPGFGQSFGRTTREQSLYSNTGSREVPLAFDEVSPSRVYRDAFSRQLSSNSDTRSLWSTQPFEQLFGVGGKTHNVRSGGVGSRPSSVPEVTSHVDFEAKLLQSFRYCIVKLLKLEGSDWLFRQNDGADEDLIDRVAASERFHYEAEARDMSWLVHMAETQYPSSDRKVGLALKNDEAGLAKYLVSSVPHCGEDCIWRVDLIVSFGVWCIHRILELSLMESRPELWGKYTYVLNRLQGILDLAFLKPRSLLPPCFCFQDPVAHLKRSSPPLPNGLLPPTVKLGRGKCTTATTLLDIIKDVEFAISSRKGRMGTAAGDVAFPKGKENLVSVLKRYKRRLSHKSAGTHGSASRQVPVPTPYGS